MAASTTMKALIFRPKGQSLAVEDVPVPVPGPKQILVRVQAVALNTVDVMNLDHPLAVQDTRVVGSDFVGVVAAIGEDLKSVDDPRAVVGARVAGFVQGGKRSSAPLG